MNIPTQDELLVRIESFCARHDMAETRFGRDAVNNPAFIRGLRDGKSPTLETLNKLSDFMDGVEREAATQAKLHAPLDVETEEEEIPLPFQPAPVNRTGASSPTSSLTNASPTSSGASASCPGCSSSEAMNGAARPNPSSSDNQSAGGPAQPLPTADAGAEPMQLRSGNLAESEG